MECCTRRHPRQVARHLPHASSMKCKKAQHATGMPTATKLLNVWRWSFVSSSDHHTSLLEQSVKKEIFLITYICKNFNKVEKTYLKIKKKVKRKKTKGFFQKKSKESKRSKKLFIFLKKKKGKSKRENKTQKKKRMKLECRVAASPTRSDTWSRSIVIATSKVIAERKTWIGEWCDRLEFFERRVCGIRHGHRVMVEDDRYSTN